MRSFSTYSPLLTCVFVIIFIIIVPMAIVEINQYVRISHLSRGLVVFDNTTAFEIRPANQFPHRVIATVRGKNTTKLYHIVYPSDQSLLKTTSMDDIQQWVVSVNNSGENQAYLGHGENEYSYLDNIENIGGWIAALVIFLGAVQIVITILCCIKCWQCCDKGPILPVGNQTFYDFESNTWFIKCIKQEVRRDEQNKTFFSYTF